MGVQIFTLIIIVIDSVLGFSNDHIYGGVEQQPVDV